MLVDGSRIVRVGAGQPPDDLMDARVTTIDAGNDLIMPGLIDVHTVFAGWALSQIGVDLEGLETPDACVDTLTWTDVIAAAFGRYQQLMHSAGV